MGHLNTIGLAMDLVGVTLLGVDLIRVQLTMRREAEATKSEIERLSEEFGGVESWMEEIKRRGRWEEVHINEGLAEYVGGFDSRAAEAAFSELADSTIAAQQNLSRIAKLVEVQGKSASKNARRSLVVSYVGLVLIVSGFALQIVGSNNV